MKVSNFGTTTLLFDDGKDQILVDANFSRPSVLQYLFGKAKSDGQLIDKFYQKYGMNRLKGLFVSHSHYDHVLDAPYIANQFNIPVYGTRTTANICRTKGVSEENIVTFSGGEEFQVGNFKIKVIPSLHSEPIALVNDIGEEVTAPFDKEPRYRDYPEGGSYDFLIENGGTSYLIHPSANFKEGFLKGYQADVVFLSFGGFSKFSDDQQKQYFDETLSTVNANTVVPVHWDFFFKSLEKPAKPLPKIAENIEKAFFKLAIYCEAHQIDTVVQLPRTSIHF